MFENFLKENNIDFSKLGIDEVTSKKLKEFMNMSYVCYFNSKNVLTDNKKLSNTISLFCKNEDIKPSIYAENLNFSGFLLALSIELSLKVIYILEEYDKIKTDTINIGKTNEEICSICLKQVRNEIRGHIETQNIANSNGLTIPRRNNGHYLISILNNISNQSVKDLIKYETILAPLKKYFKQDKLPNKDEYVDAADIITMIKEFDYTETIKTINKTYIELSDSFEKMRYNEKEEDIHNNAFLASFSFACHIILCDILRKQMYTADDLKQYLFETNEKKLDTLIENVALDKTNINKKYYDEIKQLKETNPADYYVIISKFTLEELEGIIENFKSTHSSIGIPLEFNSFLSYYIFFKRYIETKCFFYNDTMIPNISKLFKTIRETKDLSKLGNQFVNWFNNIELSDLTKEEMELIEMIDPIYIYNSLTYDDKIIWHKCKEKNIKFEVYYKFYLNNFNIIVENFSKYFESTSIEKNYLININYDNYKKRDIEELIVLSKNFGQDIKMLLDFYEKNGMEKIEEIIGLIHLFKTNFSTAVKCYQKCSLGEAKEVFDISNELNIPFEQVLEFYKVYEKEEMKDLFERLKSLKMSVETLHTLGLYHSEKEMDYAIKISSETGIDVDNVIGYYKDYSIEELKQIKELSLETGEKFCYVAEFLKKYTVEERKQLINILSENVFLLQSLQFLDDYYSINHLKDIINISKELKIPFLYTVFYYGDYSREKFKQIVDIADKFQIPFGFADDIYYNYTKEELNYLDDLSNKTGLNLRKVVELYEQDYKSQEIELLKILKNQNIKFNSKMKILSLQQILENIKLVGVSIDHIFYKTPEEIIKIQGLCNNNSFAFRKELLYFDLEVLNENIKEIYRVIEFSRNKITIDDIEWVLDYAKKYKQDVLDSIASVVEQLHKKGKLSEEINNILDQNNDINKTKNKRKVN